MTFREPVLSAATLGFLVAWLLDTALTAQFDMHLPPEVYMGVVALVAMIARNYVVPHIPENILETMERLSKGTDLEDAVVTSREKYNDMAEAAHETRLRRRQERQSRRDEAERAL